MPRVFFEVIPDPYYQGTIPTNNWYIAAPRLSTADPSFMGDTILAQRHLGDYSCYGLGIEFKF